MSREDRAVGSHLATHLTLLTLPWLHLALALAMPSSLALRLQLFTLGPVSYKDTASGDANQNRLTQLSKFDDHQWQT